MSALSTASARLKCAVIAFYQASEHLTMENEKEDTMENEKEDEMMW